MLEMICKIPDPIGWTIVGVLGVACVVMAVIVGKNLVQMWRDRQEEDENNEN